MSNILIFNPNQYLESVNTPDYESNPDVLINPDISAISGVPVKYWKRVGNTVVEMSQAEKDSTDATILAAIQTVERGASDALKTDPTAEGIEWRAVVLILLDEINALRQRDRDRSVDVANSSSLANLKTAWAARPSLEDRTIAQAKTAYSNHILSGNAD